MATLLEASASEGVPLATLSALVELMEEKERMVRLLNGYIDIPVTSALTPYVGLGIGTSMHSINKAKTGDSRSYMNGVAIGQRADETAWREVKPHLMHTYKKVYAPPAVSLVERMPDGRRRPITSIDDPYYDSDAFWQDRMIIGGPERCARDICRWRDELGGPLPLSCVLDPAPVAREPAVGEALRERWASLGINVTSLHRAHDAIDAVRRATSKIPVVMVGGAMDPVEEKVVASLAAPGGNITSDNISPLHLVNLRRVAYEARPVTTKQVVAVASFIDSDRPRVGPAPGMPPPATPVTPGAPFSASLRSHGSQSNRRVGCAYR